MAAKALLVLFAQALVIQSALSQNCGRSTFTPAAYSLQTPFGYEGFSTGWAANTLPGRSAGNSLAYNGVSSNILNAPLVDITPTSGGALPVTSASPIAPNSIVVESENVYEGTLAVAGELPFVGTVGLEGNLPTAGSGAVNHACGNGATRMISQDGAFVNNIGARYGSSAFGNMYGNIGNIAPASPFAYNSGLSGLPYPGASLAGAYPGYTSGLTSSAMGTAYGSTSLGAAGSGAAYGGAGEGNVAVAGELPVAGNTALAGQVPILGAISFSGAVPASGAVSITGQCGCGCGYQYLY